MQKVATLTAADVRGLARVYADARRFLWPVEEAGAVCQYTPQAIGVTVWEADASGMRYVVVGYNPSPCPTPVTFPIVHRDLAYLLAPDGRLLGPRVRGR